jgi:transposase
MELIQGGVEDSRHAISGEIARGLFGRGASAARPSVEGREPEPTAFVAGSGPGWNGPGLCGDDRGHGPPDLRDWVHRFNASGPEGLIDNWTEGPKPRLSEAQLAQLAQIVEGGPDREKDGVVRWRRIDLKRVIAERFGVEFHQRYVGKLLHKLGFSHMSTRPRHPAQDERIVEAFKKTSRLR